MENVRLFHHAISKLNPIFDRQNSAFEFIKLFFFVNNKMESKFSLTKSIDKTTIYNLRYIFFKTAVMNQFTP